MTLCLNFKKRTYLLSVTTCSIAQLITENRIEKSKALINPLISIPSTILTVSSTIAVLMTNWNNPKVKNVIGKAKSERIGLRKVFNKLKTIAKIVAVMNFSLGAVPSKIIILVK